MGWLEGMSRPGRESRWFLIILVSKLFCSPRYPKVPMLPLLALFAKPLCARDFGMIAVNECVIHLSLFKSAIIILKKATSKCRQKTNTCRNVCAQVRNLKLRNAHFHSQITFCTFKCRCRNRHLQVEIVSTFWSLMRRGCGSVCVFWSPRLFSEP